MAKSVVSDFFAKVETAQSTLVLTGLVKKAEDTDDAIQFSVGTSCVNWVRVPESLVQAIDFLQVVSCVDHSHPLARITFKTPPSADAKSFAALADHIATANAAVTHVLPPTASAMPHGVPHLSAMSHAPPQAVIAGLEPRPAFPSAGLAPCQWMRVFDVATNQYVYRCV